MSLPSTETALAVVFALVAAALLFPKIYAILSFLWIYTLHRSTLPSYVHSPHSYALITGASDGIGRALAIEFAQLGFNLIIHGRNAEKLERVRGAVLQRVEGSGRELDVRVWVQDAAAKDIDWEAVRRQWEDLEITVLVNNVGGTNVDSEPFDHQTLEHVDQIVQINALFPYHLTHTLLPKLRALPRPTLILNVGSMAGEIPPPHFAAYSASKAFLDRFTHALELDERLVIKSKVRFHYLQTASVLNSSGVIKRTSLGVPSAADYAKGAVRVVGAGRRTVFPWMVHGMQAGLLALLGERVSEGIMISAMKDLQKEE